MQEKTNLAKAIVAVMKEVKGIDKSMTIGSGNNSYKGVPDKEVKKIIGEAMAKNGLCILPTKVTPKIQLDRWEEVDQYQLNILKQSKDYSESWAKPLKSKQSIYTEVLAEYLLLHESGESITLAGYGQGIDTQDKGAGKATTYALKNTLLYTFLVPTGHIDDTDATHSDEAPIRNAPKKETDNRPWITLELLNKAIERIKTGEEGVYQKTIDAFRMKKEYRDTLDKLMN